MEQTAQNTEQLEEGNERKLFSFTSSINGPEMREVLEYMGRTRKILLLVFLCLGILYALTFFILKMSDRISEWAYLIPGVAIIAYAGLTLYNTKRNINKTIRRRKLLGGDEASVAFYETYLEMKNDKSSNRFQYIHYARCVELKSVWLLSFGEEKPYVSMFIPKSAVRGEKRTEKFRETIAFIENVRKEYTDRNAKA